MFTPDRRLVFLVLFVVMSPGALATSGTHSMSQIDMPFIVTLGQSPDNGIQRARTLSGAISVALDGGIRYVLPGDHPSTAPLVLTERMVNGSVLRIQGEHPTDTRVSSFRGHDPSRWQSDLPAYNLLSMGQVIPGVTLKLRAVGAGIEKLIILEPGVSPDCIQMALEGASGIEVNADGELLVQTAAGIARFSPPVAFQDMGGERHEIEAAYVLSDDGPHVYGFSVAHYDPSVELVIDPLYAATFLGGIGRDAYLYGDLLIAEDGYVYVTGPTSSQDFPVTPGAYDEFYNGGWDYEGDVFIAKLDRYFTTLIAATFLGGERRDVSTDLVVDGQGHLYVAGLTESTDFPTTPGAYDATHNGGWPQGYESDVFIAKLDMDLTTLLSATFLGGTSPDGVYNTVLKPMSDGNIYIGGSTYSLDFPTTPGCWDPHPRDGNNVFLSLMDGDLTRLLASTYVDSRGWDECYGLEVAPDGNLVFAGIAGGQGWPTTAGAYQEEFLNYGDCYISKINPELSEIVASTYLGGYDTEDIYAMTLDEDGAVYVFGQTSSYDFPTTHLAYDQTYNGGETDAFVSVMSADMTTLKASTFLGGQFLELYFNAGLVLDRENGLYVCGGTRSSNFPVTEGAFDESYAGNEDVFVSRFDRGLTTLQASTFLGMSNIERAHAVILDEIGNVYLYGQTASVNFPVTPNAFSTNHHSGGSDAFLAVFDPDLSASLMSAPEANESFDLVVRCPRPYIPGHEITFESPERTLVSIGIYDISGHRLRTILERTLSAGTHAASWDGQDAWGRPMAAGLYLCRIEADHHVAVEKVLLMR